MTTRLRVVILGATSGIAEATARLYAAEGASLLLAGRRAGRLEEIATDLRVRGADRVETVALDLAAAEPRERLAAFAETLGGIDHLLVEGGAQTAATFLAADLVDRLLLYRAPIVIGGGKAAIGDIGLGDLAGAHRRWRLADARKLGSDRLEVYLRDREAR